MTHNSLRVTRYWMPALVLALVCFLGCGQSPSSEEASQVKVDLEFEPAPPQIGKANVTLRLSDLEGQPVPGGKIELEGNMNHAGMKPVFSQLEETEPGTYQGTLEFTMGGDWFVLVTGDLPEHIRINEKVDVPGVSSPR